MTEKSYAAISPTAKLVAHVRAFTDIPYAQEFAAESGAEQAFQALTGTNAEMVSQFIPLWEARYKTTDQIIGHRGITQILEVAAGLSPRGVVMTANPRVVYVATDLPGILEQERSIAQAILARAKQVRPNLHFHAANALQPEELMAATAVFAPTQPLALITEGLLPYLDRAERAVLARNIRTLLKAFRGIWITSDVSSRQTWSSIAQTDARAAVNLRERLAIISGFTDRRIEKNAFVDEAESLQFFTQAGFQSEAHLHSEVLGQLSSIRRLNLSPAEIELILSSQKTLVLTPI